MDTEYCEEYAFRWVSAKSLVTVFLLRLYSSTGVQRLINTESKMLFFCSHGLSFIVTRIVTVWWKPLWWFTYFGLRGSLITYSLLWWLMETKAQPVPRLSPHHKQWAGCDTIYMVAKSNEERRICLQYELSTKVLILLPIFIPAYSMHAWVWGDHRSYAFVWRHDILFF